MFFRPEENTLFSKRFDDAGFLKGSDVYIGNKDDGTSPVLPMNGRLKFTGDFHFHGFRAMGAGAVDNNG